MSEEDRISNPDGGFPYYAKRPAYQSKPTGVVFASFFHLAKRATNALLGRVVGSVIFRLQKHSEHELWYDKPYGYAKLDFDVGHLITHDGAQLATVQFTPESYQNTAPENKKFIVMLNGNDQDFTDLYYDSDLQSRPRSEEAKQGDEILKDFMVKTLRVGY